MNTFTADGKAATNWDESAPPDRGEQVSLMEPMRISETSRHRAGLAGLAVELAAQAAGFRCSLPMRPGSAIPYHPMTSTVATASTI